MNEYTEAIYEARRALDAYSTLICKQIANDDSQTYEERARQLKAINSTVQDTRQMLFDNLNTYREMTRELERQNELMRYRQDDRIGMGATEGLKEYIVTMGTAREASKQLALTGIKGVENAIVSLATTGTANFREFAVSILQDTVRMITQQLILRNLLGFLIPGGAAAPAGLPSGFLTGAVSPAFADFTGVQGLTQVPASMFTTGPIRGFASGGVATGPNTGYPAVLHGTEAVIPLSGGRVIPVQMQGGGGPVNIAINVDASGTAVQGDQGSSRELARDLAAVVDDRLVYHRRRGGLLDMQR